MRRLYWLFPLSVVIWIFFWKVPGQRQERRQRQIAAIEAQRALLSQPIPGEHPDAGIRLFDPENPFSIGPGDVIGTLSDLITVDKAHQAAVELALTPWSRAIIVRDAILATRLLRQCTAQFPEETLQLLVAEAQRCG